jgi:hypothetical protein
MRRAFGWTPDPYIDFEVENTTCKKRVGFRPARCLLRKHPLRERRSLATQKCVAPCNWSNQENPMVALAEIRSSLLRRFIRT